MATLRDIMTPNPQTTGADDSVSEAAKAMVAGLFGSLLVTRHHTLVGILTERDILRAAAEGHDLSNEVVRDWMTPDPVTAGPDEDSEEAAITMMSQGFRHLPVVDGSDLLGIVSLRDVLSARIGSRG